MRTENGKIIEATRDELYHKWLVDDWAEFVSFPDYLESLRRCGVTITEESDDGKKPSVSP